MGPDVEYEHTTKPERAASALDDGLERMFRVEKADHPDLVGGIVWADCELRWINERITLAILAEREACAMEAERQGIDEPYGHAKFRCVSIAAEIRARSNADVTGLAPGKDE